MAIFNSYVSLPEGKITTAFRSLEFMDDMNVFLLRDENWFRIHNEPVLQRGRRPRSRTPSATDQWGIAAQQHKGLVSKMLVLMIQKDRLYIYVYI